MAVAVAVAVSGGVAVPVAGLTKRFFDHIQKDFLINVWGYLFIISEKWTLVRGVPGKCLTMFSPKKIMFSLEAGGRFSADLG